MIWPLILLGIVCLALFLYWALIVTEGVYLGQWAVTLLYDLTPAYYDRIKAITWQDDDETLVRPLLDWLGGVERPLILDAGAGTGRFSKALLDNERFDGRVWGLDISVGMLRRAQSRLAECGGQAGFLRGDAGRLPFPDETFDAVACLETLEFTPRPAWTLGELVRVLRPGGVLLISNRVGRARWFPGRTFDEDALLDLLARHPLPRVELHSWNSFYDLVWARKARENRHTAENVVNRKGTP